MELYARYAALKQKVGGNLEKHSFEHTMFPGVYDQTGLTRPAVVIKRILSQLEFAIKLSARYDGKWDADVEAALSLLEKTMAEEDVLTRSACMAAEQLLLPMADAAREYQVIFVGHAHIDMNWMWGWQETVAATLSTFRTVLNLMREYPEFTFMQSQASVYKIVEEYDPDMMEEIRTRIAEGRWEVTASAWVETDKNMPDTESLLHHIKVTRDYLHRVWGVAPDSVKVDFSPDTFGHSVCVPEINTFGSVPYYYHCRGQKEDVLLYRYRAPSGAEVLMYREPYWYNRAVEPDSGTGVFELEKMSFGLKTSLAVYGVGDHGGGPTRRDVEAVLEMQQWPVWPAMRFGALHEYFAIAETVREKLPVQTEELNGMLTGCYTTQSRIKLANRRAEAALVDSERMSALAHQALGTRFAAGAYDKAWQDTLFTHFHDILTGSCVQESREHAMGLLAQAVAVAQTQQSKAYEKLSQAVDTSMFTCDDDIARTKSEGAGVGYGLTRYAGVPNPERGAGRHRIYTVFNPSAAPRKELVEVTVWDYTGDVGLLEAVDSTGRTVPLQVLDRTPRNYWDHLYHRVLFEAEVPAFGWATYELRQKKVTDYPTYRNTAMGERIETPNRAIVLENEHICARFDTGSGQLHSLVDKASGKELLAAPAGLQLVHTNNAGMSAWLVGRYLGMEPVTATTHVTQETGSLRNSVTFKQEIMHSTVTMTVSLDAGAKALHYALEIDWHENGKAQEWLPVLVYRLPTAGGAKTMLNDIPAGAIVRTPEEIERPALSYACPADEGLAAALICDCKYGYRLTQDALFCTLINTGMEPDPYPERGIHHIQLYVAAAQPEPAALKVTAEQLIRPMAGVSTAAHPGSLPAAGTLLGAETGSCVVTAVSAAQDGALLVRCYETEGKPSALKLTPPFAPARAALVDLNEKELAPAAVENGTVVAGVAPYSIAAVKIWKA